MNIENLIRDLDKLKSHFSKAPNRIYSKEKLNEKLKILNKIENNFKVIFNELKDSDEKVVSGLKFKKLADEIKTYIEKQNDIITITMNKVEFLKLAAATINRSFEGDPLKLNSFIDAIELLDSIASSELKDTLILFVKTRLEGKAREIIPENPTSIQDIIKILKNKIKPENSKVVAGKIATLQIRNNDYAEFSKNVEELADALERTLVIEGMTQAKAHEMAIEQTVDVCAMNAKSEIVRTVIMATPFNDPKDVIAKLVVTQNKENSTKQILAYRAQRYNQNQHQRNGYRGYKFDYNNAIRTNNYQENKKNRNYYKYNNRSNNNNSRNRYSNRGHANNYYKRGENTNRVMTLNADAPQLEQQLREVTEL